MKAERRDTISERLASNPTMPLGAAAVAIAAGVGVAAAGLAGKLKLPAWRWPGVGTGGGGPPPPAPGEPPPAQLPPPPSPPPPPPIPRIVAPESFPGTGRYRRVTDLSWLPEGVRGLFDGGRSPRARPYTDMRGQVIPTPQAYGLTWDAAEGDWNVFGLGPGREHTERVRRDVTLEEAIAYAMGDTTIQGRSRDLAAPSTTYASRPTPSFAPLLNVPQVPPLPSPGAGSGAGDGARSATPPTPQSPPTPGSQSTLPWGNSGNWWEKLTDWSTIPFTRVPYPSGDGAGAALGDYAALATGTVVKEGVQGPGRFIRSLWEFGLGAGARIKNWDDDAARVAERDALIAQRDRFEDTWQRTLQGDISLFVGDTV